MNKTDPVKKLCLIGAGATGLASARVFRDAGIAFDCFERDDGVGGVWRFGKPSSSVSAATHLITSKRQTEFPDFPMPDSYPAYPSHAQALDYLISFAERFNLLNTITFSTSVEELRKCEGGWNVALSDGTRRFYEAVVVATGHLREPSWPAYDGSFSGRQIHSSRFRSSAELAGRRVLVVGTGSSGCDIVSDCCRVASQTFHSVRRGRHFVPKFLFGEPSDAGADWLWRYAFPLWLHRVLAWWPLHTAGIAPSSLGLPQPDHKLFSQRVIPHDQYLHDLGHGRFLVKPDIAKLADNCVHFVDGSSEEIDTIVYATGYQMRFPFLTTEQLQWRDGVPELYLNVFHPKYDDLFFVGLSEPSTKTWPVAEQVARLISLVLQNKADGTKRYSDFRSIASRSSGPIGAGGTSVARFLEVEYHAYLKQLRKVFRHFGENLQW